MTDESYSFSTAKTRLDEIVTQVRKKDTSLEKSLDLLEEGVRLANVCTELIDHADWASAPGTPGGPAIATEQSADSESAKPDAESAEDAETAESTDAAAKQDASADADPEADEPEDADSDTGNEPEGHEAADEVGEVWSEDEAWADETDDDPSDGDDGHGV
jgi:exodeoxyribonuclease VII small subunit